MEKKEKKEKDRIYSQPTCSKLSFAKLVQRVVISVDWRYWRILKCWKKQGIFSSNVWF